MKGSPDNFEDIEDYPIFEKNSKLFPKFKNKEKETMKNINCCEMKFIISRMTELNPAKRITVVEALNILQS